MHTVDIDPEEDGDDLSRQQPANGGQISSNASGQEGLAEPNPAAKMGKNLAAKVLEQFRFSNYISS